MNDMQNAPPGGRRCAAVDNSNRLVMRNVWRMVSIARLGLFWIAKLGNSRKTNIDRRVGQMQTVGKYSDEKVRRQRNSLTREFSRSIMCWRKNCSVGTYLCYSN